jgi:hypothetical protein
MLLLGIIMVLQPAVIRVRIVHMMMLVQLLAELLLLQFRTRLTVEQAVRGMEGMPGVRSVMR